MEHIYQNIEGWFSEQDRAFYAAVVSNASQKAHFVEVGSWKGLSSSFMAVEIANSGKDIRFDCVDTFKGSPEIMNDKDIDSLYDVFITNMQPVRQYYNVITLPSVEAAKFYKNKSLDFVFIDALHTYDAVKEDIKAWITKIKPGGILAGHDYPHEPVARAVKELLGEPGVWGNCWMVGIQSG